jgi:hypothetical protein
MGASIQATDDGSGDQKSSFAVRGEALPARQWSAAMRGSKESSLRFTSNQGPRKQESE